MSSKHSMSSKRLWWRSGIVEWGAVYLIISIMGIVALADGVWETIGTLAAALLMAFGMCSLLRPDNMQRYVNEGVTEERFYPRGGRHVG